MDEPKYLKYLHEIGQKLGLSLNYDENMLCEIIVNEDDGVAIIAHPEDHNLMFSAVVAADLPDPVSYSVVIDLLDLAIGPVVTRGGNSPVVGRNPDTGVLVVYQICTESFLDSGDVGELFLDFFRFKNAIQKHLAANVPEHGSQLLGTEVVSA